jgi:hypothetical protein
MGAFSEGSMANLDGCERHYVVSSAANIFGGDIGRL